MPRRRANPKDHPQLRPWKVELTIVDEVECLEVTCGWCGGGVILLQPRRWISSKRNRDYIGRSCTYCFKTGRLPTEQEWEAIWSGEVS